MVVVLAVPAGHTMLLLFTKKASKEISVHHSGNKILARDTKVVPNCQTSSKT